MKMQNLKEPAKCLVKLIIMSRINQKKKRITAKIFHPTLKVGCFLLIVFSSCHYPFWVRCGARGYSIDHITMRAFSLQMCHFKIVATFYTFYRHFHWHLHSIEAHHPNFIYY